MLERRHVMVSDFSDVPKVTTKVPPVTADINTFQTLTKTSRERRVKTWGLFPSQWLIYQTGGEIKVWQCLLLELFIFIAFFPSYWAFDTNTHKLQTCSRLFLYTPGCWWILDKEPHCCCVFIAAHCPTINRITRKGLIRLIQKLLWSYAAFFFCMESMCRSMITGKQNPAWERVLTSQKHFELLVVKLHLFLGDQAALGALPHRINKTHALQRHFLTAAFITETPAAPPAVVLWETTQDSLIAWPIVRVRMSVLGTSDVLRKSQNNLAEMQHRFHQNSYYTPNCVPDSLSVTVQLYSRVYNLNKTSRYDFISDEDTALLLLSFLNGNKRHYLQITKHDNRTTFFM